MCKSQLDNLDDKGKDLALAATYSIDRKFLYELVQQIDDPTKGEDSFVLDDDVLELKDINEPSSAIEEVLENVPTEIGVAAAASGLAFSQKEITTINEDIEESIESPIEEVIEDMEDIEEVELEDSTIIEKVFEEEIEEEDVEEELEEQPEAENIPDNSEITYMEKPKNRKSVIEQLMKKNVLGEQETQNESNHSLENTVSNLEDELETLPEPKENFMDISPVKEKPTISREVLFEISDKTDKEMDALMQKANEIEKDEVFGNTLKEEGISFDENVVPAPRSEFKSYMEQFDSSGSIEDLESETELTNAIDEVIEEEIESAFKKEKKSKKKKKKKDSKKAKAKKEKKSKKKKKSRKEKIRDEAMESVKESSDILSETLAGLLAQQGSKKKAIKMYERLSLIFPEKSGFFAEKIEKLRNKK